MLEENLNLILEVKEVTEENYTSEVKVSKLSHRARFLAFKHRTKIETLRYFVI